MSVTFPRCFIFCIFLGLHTNSEHESSVGVIVECKTEAISQSEIRELLLSGEMSIYQQLSHIKPSSDYVHL